MNVGEALARVDDELRSRRTLTSSMKRLAAEAQLDAEIDFAADAGALAVSLGALVAKLPPRVTGVCFFLDGEGGLDVMRCTGWTPGAALETWTDTARPGGKLRSRALRKAYATVAAGAAEYAVCLGYAGLALRDGLRALGNDPVERAIAWGFHDGDTFVLGIHGPRGFRPARSAKALLDLAAKEIAELPTNHGNWHGTFGTLVSIAKELHDRRDRASLVKLTARADGAAQSLDLRKGWIAACVLSHLAVLHGWVGEMGRADELLFAAETAAAKERNASHRLTATLSLRGAFDQLAQPDRARRRGPRCYGTSPRVSSRLVAGTPFARASFRSARGAARMARERR